MGKIAEFYNNKSVLITGATGFCGKALVEKLLRACDGIKKIYVLAREKKNVTAQQRLRTYVNENVFDLIRKTNPEKLEKIVFIDGDISKDGLNLGYQDQQELIEKVDVVFHCAATVNFNDPINIALNTNVMGLKRMAEFSLTIQNLKSFVYMSTAYCHCNKQSLDETYHDTGLNFGEIWKEIGSLDEEGVRKFEEKILKDSKYPNTYSISKGIAEDVVEGYKKLLPIAVIRPCIVSGANDSPLEGWIDGIHSGATGIIAGSMTGLVRSMYCGKTTICHFTPVDFVANATITCGYKRATTESEENLYYNCLDSKDNEWSWMTSIQTLDKVNKPHVPRGHLAWYPKLVPTSNYYWHIFCLFMFQLVPAVLFDGIRMMRGEKRFMYKLQKRIIKGISVLYYFTTTEFDFSTEKLKKLFNELDPDDKKTFNFDHTSFKWDETLSAYCLGVRKYLLKEESDTVPEAQRKLRNLWIIDVSVKAVFAALMTYVIARAMVF